MSEPIPLQIREAIVALDRAKELMVSIQDFDGATQCRDMSYNLRQRLKKRCPHCGAEIKEEAP